MHSSLPRRVLITGANGNLGRKLTDALLAADPSVTVIALDRSFGGTPPPEPRVLHVEADLLAPGDGRLATALEGVGAVVHFAAQNPYPDASWADAAASLEMTAHLFEAAGEAGVARVVFASSNHVMGGYKDNDVALSDGGLTPDLPPLTGTHTRSEHGAIDSTAYAAAKLMGERLLAAKGAAGAFTAVSLRIGWCQPGANLPETISAAGTPKSGQAEGDGDMDRDLRWFRGMWLSNRDFVGFVLAAITADAAAWPAPAIVVNAMSDNRPAPWNLEAGRRYLDYQPQDNIWARLGITLHR